MTKTKVPAHLQAEMVDDALSQDEQAEHFVALPADASKLGQLAEEMQGLRDQADELEGQAKQLKDRYNQIRQQELPELMQALGMVNSAGKGSFTFSGGRVHIETKVYASVRKEDTDAFHEWLRKNNAEDLIREAVNAQTLSAFVRERRGEDLPDPPYVVTYEERVAKITKVKG
jgi:hypothetical protein